MKNRIISIGDILVLNQDLSIGNKKFKKCHKFLVTDDTGYRGFSLKSIDTGDILEETLLISGFFDTISYIRDEKLKILGI